MLTPEVLRSKFEQASSFSDYIGGDREAEWRAFYDAVTLEPEQRALLEGMTRRVHALAVSGVWCGDCVQQLPFLARFEEANPDRFRVRFLDRDSHLDLAERLKICGGMRVPVVLFMNEDFDFLSLFGDRSLSRYRAMAARQLGAACPLPGAPVDEDERRATCEDWLAELERVHLICRLSPKLRSRHGD